MSSWMTVVIAAGSSLLLHLFLLIILYITPSPLVDEVADEGGIEDAVAQKLEESTVQAVGARFGGGVVETAGAVVFGRVGVLLHAELLQRVDRRLNPAPALVLFTRIRAVQIIGHLPPADPRNCRAVEKLGSDARHIPRPR